MKPGKSQTEEVSVYNNSEGSDDQISLEKHISDSDIHTSEYEKQQISELSQKVSSHTNDGDLHVSPEQAENWDSKETKAGAQEKANKVKSIILKHENNYDSHVTPREKEEFRDKYTRSEINALLSSILSGINWLEEVESYDELLTKYTSPNINDTCTVLENGLSYTYNGKNWVVSLVTFLPIVTPAQDGKMSKEDKQKLDSIETGANRYIHPDDELTRHVSDLQIESWENKANDVEVSMINRGLMSPLDKKKLDTVEHNANFYQHPSMHNYRMIETDDAHQFISKEEKEYFGNKVDMEILEEKLNTVVEEATRHINNTIANLANTTPELYRFLTNIRGQMSSDIVCLLLKEVASKLDSSLFELHEKDTAKHVTTELMTKIDKLLSDPRSDWSDTNVDSPTFIKNKPKALPANGGDSATVGGYKAEALFSNRRSDTIVIGTLKANCLEKSVDFICDGTNDTAVIQQAFNSISTSGGRILFREGSYNITNTLVLNGNNIQLDSCNATLVKEFSEGALLSIAGDCCRVENINFAHATYPVEKNVFIEINGSKNRISRCAFNNACAILLGSGSYNHINENTIIDPFYGIKVEPTKSNCTFNSIENNTITGGQYGIILKANSWSVLHNFIKSNSIINCSVGLLLTSHTQINDKISCCGISGNHILRGFGDDSAYGTNQKDILIEYGYRNIIIGNTLKKVEIRGSKNVSANNTIL